MTIDSVPITKTAVYDGANNTVRVPSSANSGSVALSIPTSTRASKVISCGVPLPNFGVSDTSEIVLRNEVGVEIPAQFDVLTYWPNGSFMWVLVTAQVSPSSTQEKIYSLDYGAGVSQANYTTDMSYTEDATEIVVNTNKYRVVIDKDTGLLKSAFADTAGDQTYATQVLGQAVIHIQNALDDSSYQSANEVSATVEVRRSGTHQIAIKASGRLRNGSNEAFCRYDLYYYFKEGAEEFDFDFVVVDDRTTFSPSGNSFSYFQDKVNPEWAVRNLRVEIPHLISSSPQYIFGGESTNVSGALTSEVFQYQTGQRFLNRQGAFSQDPSATAFSERTDATSDTQTYSGVQSGSRAPGFASVHNGVSGATCKIRNFWKEWPNELRMDTSKIIMEVYPARHNDGNLILNYDFPADGDHWIWPNVMHFPRTGSAKEFKMTICIHSGTPNQDELRSISDDRDSHTIQLRATEDHYCSSQVWGDIIPSNENTAAWDRSLVDNYLLYFRSLYPNRAYIYGKNFYGFEVRNDTGSNFNMNGSVAAWPGMKCDQHYGSQTYFRYYLMDFNNVEWLDYSFDATKLVMDVSFTHGITEDYYTIAPLPPGMSRQNSHALSHQVDVRDQLEHHHVSSMPEYYWFKGDLRCYDVMDMIKDHNEYMSVWRFPVPRPLEGGSRTRALGERVVLRAERYLGTFLHSTLRITKALSDFDFYVNNHDREITNLIEWWQAGGDIWLGGEIVGTADHTQGTGTWLLDHSDNTGTSNFTTVNSPWMVAILINAVIDWYDYESLLGTGAVDLQTVRNMLYQVLQHVNTYGWNESGNRYWYSPGNQAVTTPPNALRLLASPAARIYTWYKQDLADGNISNPEWYDHATWKERILIMWDTIKFTTHSPYPPGIFSYEGAYPYELYKLAPIIEADGV